MRQPLLRKLRKSNEIVLKKSATIQKDIASFQNRCVFLGSTSIVGVAKKNKYQVVSSGNSRHDFYAWENKILFLKLRKFRIPKQTRFKTLVLLLQPSMKPFDHGAWTRPDLEGKQPCFGVNMAQLSPESSAWTDLLLDRLPGSPSHP